MWNSRASRYAAVVMGIAAAEVAVLPVSGAGAASEAQVVQVPANGGTIEERLQVAQEMREHGDLRGALRELTEVARLQRRSGLNAAETYWQIAEVRNAMGHAMQGAQALDAVASEAAAFGDFDLRARATVEAAVLYSQARQPRLAQDRLDQLQVLLRSPYVSPEVREGIAARYPQARARG